MLKKIGIFILTVSLLTGIFSPAGEAAKSYFARFGLEEEQQAEFMEKCIVMRIGNCEGYVKNRRAYMYEGNHEVRPFLNGETVYIPLRFVLDGLDAAYRAEDGKLSFSYGGTDFEIYDGDTNSAKKSNGQIFLPLEKAAELLGLSAYVKDKIIFLSTEKELFADGVPEEVFEKVSQYLEYEWQFMNMGSALGYVTGVYVHPENPELMYATGDVSGMFRYNNEAEIWTECNRGIFEYGNCNFSNSMGGIALDPSNENIVYAVFGNSTVDRGSEGYSMDIFKSEDYGKSWTRTFFEKDMCGYGGRTRWATKQIAVDPNNPDIVYAGTRFDGLWKSEKGAEEGSWREVSGLPKGPSKDELKDSAGIAGIVFDGKSEIINGKTSVIYVSVLGYGVYKSNDCGETFSLMPGSPKIGAQCMLFINGHIYAAGASETLPEAVKEKYGIIPGVYKFDGKEWHDITPTKSAPWYNSIAVNPENENQLFVFKEGWTSSSAINCRSLDGGKTWGKIPYIKDYNCMGTAVFGKYKGENAVYAPWGFGIYRITNLTGKIEDLKVEEVSKGFDLLCVFSMRSIPSLKAPKLLIACADFGQRAVDDFYSGSYKTTTCQENSYGLAYCNSDPSIVMTGGSKYQKSGSGFLEMSTDYGRTYTRLDGWNVQNAPTSIAVSATKQANGYPVLMAYSSTGEKGIHRSLDFGKTWELCMPDKILEGTSNGRALNADAVDGNKFYMLLTDGSFYATTDSGATWKRTYTFNNLTRWPQTTKSVPNMEGHVWVNGRSDGIYTTSDGGYTWSKLPDVDYCYCFGFGKNKDGEKIPSAYIYGKINGHEGIYRSDDYCKTWTEIGNPAQLPGYLCDIEGDANVYGRVYIGAKSLLCGQFAETGTDDGIPVITLDNQSSGSMLDTKVNSSEYTVSGKVSKAAEVRVNGSPAQVNGDHTFTYTAKLKEGNNRIRIEAADARGNMAKPVYITVNYDPAYMGLYIGEETTVYVKESTFTVNGRVSDPCFVKCNDDVISVGEDKEFTMTFPLEKYENKYNFSAYDDSGHKSEEITLTVIHDNIPPELTLENIETETDSGILSLKGTLDEEGEVKINGELITPENRSFWKLIQLNEGENSVYIQARDTLKNVMKPKLLKINRKPANTEDLQIQYAGSDFQKNFVFDGKTDEWELPYKMNVISGSPTNMARFGLRWDETYLYVGIEVKDDILSLSAPQAYNNDAVEIYLDGDNSKSTPYDEYDKQLIYQWGKKNTDREYLFAETENGYSMEIKIPWTEINTEVMDGCRIGFDIDVCDNDSEDGTRCGVIIFNGYESDFKDTSRFATLSLIK